MTQSMNPNIVICKNCRRHLGRAGKVVSNVICNRASCTYLGFPHSVIAEDRDAIMEALERAGVDRMTIGTVGKVSKQRVGQILAARSAA